MVRYYIVASDALNNSSRWPLFEQPLDSEEYLGTVVADPALTANCRSSTSSSRRKTWAAPIRRPAALLLLFRRRILRQHRHPRARQLHRHPGQKIPSLDVQPRASIASSRRRRADSQHIGPGRIRRSRLPPAKLITLVHEPGGCPGPFNYPVRLQLNGSFTSWASIPTRPMPRCSPGWAMTQTAPFTKRPER